VLFRIRLLFDCGNFVSAEGDVVVKALVWQYGKELMRNPWEVLMMLGLTVLFAFVISGGSNSAQSQNDVRVRVYSTSLSDEALHGIVDRLNSEKPAVQFSIVTEEEAMELMNREVVEGVVNLEESSYEIVVQREGTMLVPLVQPLLDQFYTTERLTDVVGDPVREKMNQLAEAFTVEKESMQRGSQFDPSLHFLFGFTLYFSIFTTANSWANFGKSTCATSIHKNTL